MMWKINWPFCSLLTFLCQNPPSLFKLLLISKVISIIPSGKRADLFFRDTSGQGDPFLSILAVEKTLHSELHGVLCS